MEVLNINPVFPIILTGTTTLFQNDGRKNIMFKRTYLPVGFALVAMMLLAPLGANIVTAQSGKGKTAETKSQKSRGEGKDENIKNNSVANDPKATMEAPPEKGGKKTRGAYASVVFDNYTAYKIQLYANGDYLGVVSPFGNGKSYATPGSAELYGRADFTDGTVLTWGPQTASLDAGGTFTWKLR
jgi:hypothetical protein